MRSIIAACLVATGWLSSALAQSPGQSSQVATLTCTGGPGPSFHGAAYYLKTPTVNSPGNPMVIVEPALFTPLLAAMAANSPLSSCTLSSGAAVITLSQVHILYLYAQGHVAGIPILEPTINAPRSPFPLTLLNQDKGTTLGLQPVYAAPIPQVYAVALITYSGFSATGLPGSSSAAHAPTGGAR